MASPTQSTCKERIRPCVPPCWVCSSTHTVPLPAEGPLRPRRAGVAAARSAAAGSVAPLPADGAGEWLGEDAPGGGAGPHWAGEGLPRRPAPRPGPASCAWETAGAQPESKLIPAWQEPCSSPYFFLYSRGAGRERSRPQPRQCVPGVCGAARRAGHGPACGRGQGLGTPCRLGQPSPSQLLAFAPAKEQAVGVWAT